MITSVFGGLVCLVFFWKIVRWGELSVDASGKLLDRALSFPVFSHTARTVFMLTDSEDEEKAQIKLGERYVLFAGIRMTISEAWHIAFPSFIRWIFVTILLVSSVFASMIVKSEIKQFACGDVMNFNVCVYFNVRMFYIFVFDVSYFIPMNIQPEYLNSHYLISVEFGICMAAVLRWKL